MKDVFSAINSQHGDQRFIFHKVEYRATLDSLQRVDEADVLTYTIEFEPGNSPLYCYWMGITDSEAGKLTKASELTVVSLPDGKFVPHVRVPVINPDNPSARYQAIFFKTLVAGTRYKLVHVETGTKLLDKLHVNHKDELGFQPNRVQGVIADASLVVDVPMSFARGCHVVPRLNQNVIDLNVSEENITGYKRHLVRARNVPGVFALDFYVDH